MTPTTLAALGGAAALLAYLSSRLIEARRAARIRVRIETRRSAPRPARRQPRL